MRVLHVSLAVLAGLLIPGLLLVLPFVRFVDDEQVPGRYQADDGSGARLELHGDGRYVARDKRLQQHGTWTLLKGCAFGVDQLELTSDQATPAIEQTLQIYDGVLSGPTIVGARRYVRVE